MSQNNTQNYETQTQNYERELEEAMDAKISEIDISGDPVVEIEKPSDEDMVTNYSLENIPGT